MKQKNSSLYSFGLILSTIMPILLHGDIGSDTNIIQFNTQQTITSDGQRVATLAALNGGFALNNGVTGTWDSIFPFSGSLALNGGTLSLNRDLLCRDVSSFQSLGSIFGNSHSLGIANSMGTIPITTQNLPVSFSNIALQLDGDVALNGALINFTGNCKINGGGNALSFDATTRFVIAAGATLYLDNIFAKNIGSANFVFQDASSCLKLSNVTFQLADNISQNRGNVLVDGPMTLITKNFNWRIHDAALMTINGVTLWADPVGSFPAGALIFGDNKNLNLVSNGIIKAASSVLVDSSGNPIDFTELGKRDPLDDALSTSTGFLQSQIDLLMVCCANLQTSTGELQSEIDVTTNALFTSTGFLQSEIDACCAALATSTGFLQSEIDAPGCFECPDCCNVSFLTRKAWLSPDLTHFSDNVSTGDWSFDSKYVAIGLSNFSALLDGTPAVQVYELTGASLTLRATFSFDCTRDISEIRWHPSEYRLAVGRGDAKIATPCVTQLHIFDFNPIASTLTNTSNGEANHSVNALSWRQAPLDGSHDILAVGREVNAAELAIYTVDTAGVLSGAPIVTATTIGQVQFKALDWAASSTYLAVGVEAASPQNTLQIFAFNPVGPTLTLATSDAAGGHTALSVNWNQQSTSTDLLAVGLSSFPNPADSLVQVYRFTAPSTLTSLCGISGLDNDIPAVDWHPNGKCLAITQDFDISVGSQFITYGFNKASCIFTQDSFYQYADVNLEEVRWAPNGRYVLVTNDFCDSTAPSTLCPSGSIPGAVTIYNNACLSFTELVSIVDELSSCCDELKTSTGFLQSEIDSCCAALQTSTGFLQSQIDLCCGTVTTPTCIIIISTDTFYDPLTMQPPPHGATVFQFSPCVGANEIPNFFFAPQTVTLPVDSQLIFQGEGTVVLQGTGSFNMQGTDINDNTTPPNLVIQDKATMLLDTGAVWTVQGVGRYILREDGQLVLNDISQMIFGGATTDQLEIQVQAASAITLNVPTTIDISPTNNAFVTLQLGTITAAFDDFSALDIRRGIFELNTNKGAAAQGNIQQLTFTDSSSINIQRNAETGGSVNATWLGLAPNIGNATINFDNRTGVIYGNGDMFFNDLASVNTVLILQDNFLLLNDTMVNLFLNLAIRLGPNAVQIKPSDLNIVVQMGQASTVGSFLQWAAIKPARDGTIQLLQNGDHDVAYRSNSFVVGFNQNARYFEISSSGNRVTY